MIGSMRDKLEKGKQLGKIFSFEIDGEALWSSVAIQKCGNLYKVYIDEILESNMDSGDYHKEMIRSFSNLDEAISFIKENSNVRFQDLKPLRGQKIFNPLFTE